MGQPGARKSNSLTLATKLINMHDPLNAASRDRNSRTGYYLNTIMYDVRVKRPDGSW